MTHENDVVFGIKLDDGIGGAEHCDPVEYEGGHEFSLNRIEPRSVVIQRLLHVVAVRKSTLKRVPSSDPSV